MKEQKSIDTNGQELILKGKGRHDPCVVPRADKLLNDLIDNLVELQLERKILNPNV